MGVRETFENYVCAFFPYHGKVTALPITWNCDTLCVLELGLNSFNPTCASLRLCEENQEWVFWSHRHPFPFLPLVFDCPASYPFFFSSREHSNPTLVTRLGPRVSDWLGLLLNGLSPFLPPLPNVSSAHSLGLAFPQSIQASGLSSLPLGLALYQSFWASHLFI